MWLDFLSLASSSLDLLDLRSCSLMLRESFRESLQSPHRYAYPWGGIYSGSGSCPLACFEASAGSIIFFQWYDLHLEEVNSVDAWETSAWSGDHLWESDIFGIVHTCPDIESFLLRTTAECDVIMLGRPWFEFELRPYFGARPFLMRTPSYLAQGLRQLRLALEVLVTCVPTA